MRSTGSFFFFFVCLALPGPLFAAYPNSPLRPGAVPQSDVAPAEIKKVIADFSAAIRANPNDAKAYTARGKAYNAIREFDKALADFDAAIKLRPADADLYFDRAAARELSELIYDAIDDLTNFIRLRPNNAVSYYHRGRLYLRENELLEAIADLTSAVKLDPDHCLPFASREGAVARLDQLFRTSETAGSGLVRVVNLDEARREVARQTAAILVDPTNADAYAKRCAASEQGIDPVSALADAGEALRLNPKNLQWRLHRAALFIRFQEPEKALKDCEEAVRLRPDCADAYTVRAMVYIGRGSDEKALADMQTAVRINPTAYFTHLNLGMVHELRGALDAAIADYTEAIRLAPRDDDTFYRRGRAHVKKGENALALEDFGKAISLAPSLPRGYRQRAAVYRNLGDQVAARRDLEQAIFFQKLPHYGPIPDNAKPAEEEAPLSVSLTPEMWQALPANIIAVKVAPDGRPWYEVQGNRTRPDSIAQRMATIESQFSRPAPVYAGGRVALFEPGGRVWFYDYYSRGLIGYDGKTWLLRSLSDENEGNIAGCSTRGGLFAGEVSRFAGSTAWFLGAQGVYRFDGTDWHYQTFSKPGPGQIIGRLLLAAAADGRTAVAAQNLSTALWIFRDGRWQEHAISEPPAAARRAVRRVNGPYYVQNRMSNPRSLAIAADGTIWMLMEGGDCRRFDLDGNELASSPAGLQFQSLSQLLQDESGRIFLASKDISDGVSAPGPGLAIIAADGKATLLSGAEFERGLSSRFTNVVLTPSGKQAWLPFHEAGEPARLLDFDKKLFIDVLPRGDCDAVCAVQADGRVFARISSEGPHGGPIMVYTPTGSAGRELQREIELPMRGEHYAAADDGAIWFTSSAGQVMRLQDASPPAQIASASALAAFLPGHHGILLAATNNSAALYRGRELIARGNISDLIEEHTADFREGFDPRALREGSADPTSTLDITADKSGNIWWRDAQRRLLVWDGQQWHNAHEALIAGGSHDGAANWIRPLGDGSKIYVYETPNYSNSTCCFQGELSKEKFRFVPARSVPSRIGWPPPGIRDLQGGLWIPIEKRSGPNFLPVPHAARIDQGDNAYEVSDAGEARAVDRSGSVWLAASDFRSNVRGLFLIWRNGKIVERIRVPACQEYDPLASDRPGSVYIVTSAGLTHYVAEGPDYQHYHLQADYRLRDLSGIPRALFVAPPGYLSIVSSQQPRYNRSPLDCRLTLLKIPK